MRNVEDNILNEIFTFKHFAIASIIGSVAYSIYLHNSWIKLLVKIPIATILGYGIGIALVEHTGWSFSIIASVCSIVGAMTDYVIQGLIEIIRLIPKLIDRIICKKIGINIENGEVKDDTE